MQENTPLVFKYSDIEEKGGLEAELTPDPALYADVFDRPDVLKSLRLELNFSVGGDSILLEGRVYAEMQLECSRCTDPVTRSFEDSFDEVYPDTLEYVDTREVIRETVALLAPIKVLCSEACKGRCLVCGINRNRQTCGCTAGNFGAFNALKDFKIGDDKKTG